jgi:hypothetical protein
MRSLRVAQEKASTQHQDDDDDDDGNLQASATAPSKI